MTDIDRAAAETVMGWVYQSPTEADAREFCPGRYKTPHGNEPVDAGDGWWYPTENLEQATLCLDTAGGQRADILIGGNPTWSINYWRKSKNSYYEATCGTHRAKAKTAAEAATLCALTAMGWNPS